MTALNTATGVSNLQVMRALLAKDWRLFRVPVIALVVVAVLCYGLGGVAALDQYSYNSASQVFFDVCIYAADLTVLLAAVFGGVAIAGERNDRTADFVAMLPVTRTQIIVSKWLVSGLMLGMWGVLHAAVAFAILVGWQHGQTKFSAEYFPVEFVPSLALGIACTISFYGVAWLLGTFTQSATISAGTAIGVTFFLAYLVAYTMHEQSYNGGQIQFNTVSLTMALGCSSLLAGTIYYQRRVAP